MATWAIGDVQGCFASLTRLLAMMAFDVERDRVWFVGDLVNRGPESASVLRLVRGLGDAATTVLGNHDVHLLARFAGARPKESDTLSRLLAEPDAPALMEWLRLRPLLHEQTVGDTAYVLVHAGLSPRWSLDDARSSARVGEALLRGPRWIEDVRALRGGPSSEASTAIATLTRVRMVHGNGEPSSYSGELHAAPFDHRPWWVGSPVIAAGHTVVFGHWAALGLYRAPGLLGIDTGCVWGNQLTAVRLEDGALRQQPCVDPLPLATRGND